MSLEQFSYTPPTDMRGLDDFATDDMQPFVSEFIRRDEQRFTSLVNAIRNQALVDPSLLPAQTSGQSNIDSSAIVATSDDITDAEIFGTLWEA